LDNLRLLNIVLAICGLVAYVVAAAKFATNQAHKFVGSAVHDSLTVHIERSHRGRHAR
jgi:hypothetical protein